MDIKTLTKDIIENGRRLKRGEDLNFFLSANLEELCEGANQIREALCGNHVDLCSIVNGRSGKCSENCKFCAQSGHHCTGIDEYPFLDVDTIIKDCNNNANQGVHRFSIVTAGRTLDGKDFDNAISTYKRLNQECDIKLCASHGLLTTEQFQQLYDSGVRTYHCNIETSKRNFPNICTTHTYQDKIDCIGRAKSVGLKVCSGGIIGMGETWQDRLDMAISLSELEVSSIPINVLMPIKGTPLENQLPISYDDILRTVAIFRYINPTVYIRLAGGRKSMKNSGQMTFLAGANATITGDMLTTSGNNIKDDKNMLTSMGFDISK